MNDARVTHAEVLLGDFARDVLTGRSVEQLTRFFSPYFVDHDPLPDQVPACEDIVVRAPVMLRLPPRGVYHVEVSFADGDRLGYRIFGSGSHVPRGAGPLSPLCIDFTLSRVGIMRVDGGRFVESWGPWIYRELPGPRPSAPKLDREGTVVPLPADEVSLQLAARRLGE